MKKVIYGILFFILTLRSISFTQSLLLEKLDVNTLRLLMGSNRNMLIMQQKGGKYSGGERYVGVIVNAPFEKCWQVVTDIENYKEFVPMMSESKISSKTKNEIIVDFTVEVKFLGIGCTESYQQKFRLKKAQKIIELVDIKTGKVTGGWRFIPIDANRTILLYNDIAPEIEKMCWTARAIVKISPDSELAIQSSPPFVFIAAVKDRIEKK